jgi:NADH dehydrogenase
VVVEPDLSLPGHFEVFVARDTAAVPGPGSAAPGERDLERGGTRRFLPQLAQVALQSGDHAARQVISRLEGRPTTPFVYHDKGTMATIGRRSAAAQLPRGAIVRGSLGWIAWLVLHLVYLIGFRNRVVVLVNWVWRYFRWPSGPRLMIGDIPAGVPTGSRQRHIDCPECRAPPTGPTGAVSRASRP